MQDTCVEHTKSTMSYAGQQCSYHVEIRCIPCSYHVVSILFVIVYASQLLTYTNPSCALLFLWVYLWPPLFSISSHFLKINYHSFPLPSIPTHSFPYSSIPSHSIPLLPTLLSLSTLFHSFPLTLYSIPSQLLHTIDHAYPLHPTLSHFVSFFAIPHL